MLLLCAHAVARQQEHGAKCCYGQAVWVPTMPPLSLWHCWGRMLLAVWAGLSQTQWLTLPPDCPLWLGWSRSELFFTSYPCLHPASLHSYSPWEALPHECLRRNAFNRLLTSPALPPTCLMCFTKPGNYRPLLKHLCTQHWASAGHLVFGSWPGPSLWSNVCILGAVSMPAPDTVMGASKACSMCLVSCRPGWSHGGLGRAATGAWLASCLQGRSTGNAWPCPSVPSPIPPVFPPVFGNSENVSCNSELMQKRAVTYWPSRFWEVMLLGVNVQSFIISTVPSLPMTELAVPTLQERPEISSERPKSCLGYPAWLKERQTTSNSCWSAFRPDDQLEYTQFSLWIQNILLLERSRNWPWNSFYSCRFK